MKAIISAAYLKTLWDQEHKTLLGVLMPLLAEIIRKYNYVEINPTPDEIDKLTRYFYEEFGIELSQHMFIALLEKASKQKLLSKHHNKYEISQKELAKYQLNLSDTTQKIAYLIKVVYDRMREVFPEVQCDMLELQNTLFSLLQFFSIYDIQQSLQQYYRTISEKDIFRMAVTKTLINVYERHPEIRQILLEVLAGNVLVQLLMYNPPIAQNPFKGIIVYLDTPIIFAILGIRGTALAEVYEGFVKGLSAAGADVRVFEHTYEEIINILEGCRKYISSEDYDPIKASPALRYFKSVGWSESDIVLLIIDLEKRLNALGIKVDRTYHKRLAKKARRLLSSEDVDKLKDMIREAYLPTPTFLFLGEKEKTIERDTQSIASVLELREHHSPRDLRQTQCVFVTSNLALAHVARVFHEKVLVTKASWYIPSCVSDDFWGALLWLNSPKTNIDILAKNFLPHAMAIVSPTPSFLEQWFREIKRLKDEKKIGEEEYIILSNTFVIMDMMDTYQLTASGGTILNPLELIEKIKAEAAHEERKKLEPQLLEAARQKEDLDRAQLQIADLEKRLRNIEQSIDRFALLCAYAMFYLVMIMCCFVPTMLSYTTWKISTIVGGVATFVTILLGEKRRRFIAKLHKRIKKKMLWMFKLGVS